MNTPQASPAPGQGTIVDKVIQAGLCVNCGACVGGCPYFNYFDGKVVLMDRCHAEDGRCLHICPGLAATTTDIVQATEFKNGIGPHLQVVAARAGNQNAASGVQRSNHALNVRAQNGGTVTQLLIHALKTQRISAAVITDRGQHEAPAGRLAQTPEEILNARGARYSASASLAALNQALQSGATQLGVVGLPCQMQALTEFEKLSDANDSGTLPVTLKIGLFCTWALDYRSFAAYLTRKGIPAQAALHFEIPPPPAEKMIVHDRQVRHELPLSDIRAFIQPGCALCQDMTSYWADIAIGADEGREDWNTVIIRTETGRQLFESAVAENLLETRPFSQSNLALLQKAARGKTEKGHVAREKMRPKL